MPLPCAIIMNNVRTSRILWRPEKETSGGLHGGQRTSPLRLPRARYAEGYAAGKDKTCFEVIASLEGPPHAEGCGCQPCQVKRVCLR